MPRLADVGKSQRDAEERTVGVWASVGQEGQVHRQEGSHRRVRFKVQERVGSDRMKCPHPRHPADPWHPGRRGVQTL